MSSYSVKIIERVLEVDPDFVPAEREQILALVRKDTADELTERETAQLLGCSVMTVNRWRRGLTGNRPFPIRWRQTPGGQYRYNALDAKTHVARTQKGPRP